MAGKVAVLTAAAGEFGRAIASGFAREGADLFLQDFPERQSRLSEVAREIEAMGRRVVARICDISVGSEVDALTRQLIEEFGRVDVLVNCAFNSVHGLFFEIAEQDFERSMAIGPKSYFLTCQYIGKEMARRGSGKIVNLTSIVGQLGSGGTVPNCADRGAVDAMTKAIAHALGPYGIQVNALARGASSVRGHGSEETSERLRRLALGRLGRPEDVVGPAIFLATSDSDWVTGTILYADAGYTSGAVTDDQHRPRQVPYRGP